jgi:hypothetical protein
LNLAKEKRVAVERKDDDPKKIKCFRCQGMGHHQKDCSNPLICHKCKEERHMAAECLDFHAKSRELKMFGFAIVDQGFYSVSIPGERSSTRPLALFRSYREMLMRKRLKMSF